MKSASSCGNGALRGGRPGPKRLVYPVHISVVDLGWANGRVTSHEPRELPLAGRVALADARRSEDEHVGALVAPGIPWKAGLPGCRLEHLFYTPALVTGHLRQEQPAPAGALHDQPVDARSVRGRILEWDRAPQDGDMYRQRRHLALGDREEARVAGGGTRSR